MTPCNKNVSTNIIGIVTVTIKYYFAKNFDKVNVKNLPNTEKNINFEHLHSKKY